MSVTITPGQGNVNVIISAEMIRDALLSLPDSERKFIITDPEDGEDKVYSLARNTKTGKIALNCNKP